MLKLNLGSHGSNMEGYVNVDLDDPTADLKADVSNLPYGNDSVDEVYASHILEHFPMGDYELHLTAFPNKTLVIDVLKEWHRILKTNGKLTIKVPDLDKIIWLRQNFPAWARGGGPDGIFPNSSYWITGNGQHGALFDKGTMRLLLSTVGFTNIQFIDLPPRSFVDRQNLEMEVICIK